MKSQPQPNVVRGTPIDEKALKHGKTFSVTYEPKLRYAWDTGEAIGRYLEELKQGRLIARRCGQCERVMIPPRMFCQRCFCPTDDWVYVKDTGRILNVVKKIRPGKVRIGMAVRAVWKPKPKRIGSVTDIAYWQPIEKSQART